MDAPNLAAILPAPHANLEIQQLPVPTPGPDELLVRNHAVALNPIDWKRQTFGIMIPSYPAVLGADLSGTVVAVGDSVTGFSPGDRVFAVAHGLATGKPANGAYQTYTVVRASTTSHLPEGLDLAQGAVQAAALGTATIALVDILGLSLPGLPFSESTSTGTNAEVLLVWGAASTVGTMAVQLAKLSGYTVFATASPKHHDKIRALGADVVVDYRSPTAVDDLLAAAATTGKDVVYAVDTISLAHTLKPVAEVLARSNATTKKVAHTLPWATEVAIPDGVEAGNIGMGVLWGPREDLGKWLYHTAAPGWFADAKIVPVAHRVVEGGLGGIQRGLDELKGGKVSGEKLIVEV